jgi:threonine dehydrogenase-like Zn-dependent dehydrogenase
MGTGHYAALLAGVHPGGTVAIVGDGAVGFCGVLAARRLGAERIILLGHQAQRLELAHRFGATDLITSRGEQAEREVIELTEGGAESVMECVGTKESMDTAVAIAPSRRDHRLRRCAPWQRTAQSWAALWQQYRPTRWGGTCSGLSP